MSAAEDRRARRLEEEPPVLDERTPPHDLSAEAAVLSAAMLRPDDLDLLRSITKPSDFYSVANARVFEAIDALAEAKTPVDIVSVGSWLRDRERLAQVGGPGYLAQLSDATPDVAHVDAHARIVQRKRRLRRAIARCQIATAEGYGAIEDEDVWLESLMRDIGDIAMSTRTSKAERAGVTLTAWWKEFQSTEAKPVGLAFGFPDIDRKLGGLQRKRAYVIGARPGVGKSSFARAVAMNVASADPGMITIKGVTQRAPRHGVLILALEMTKEETAIGMLCSEAGVDPKKITAKTCTNADYGALMEAAPALAHMPILIDDTPGRSLADIRAACKLAEVDLAREGVELVAVIVDQIQLVKGAGRKGASRQQELGDISRGLKELAKERNLAVIELAALNRDSEKDKRRPQLSDLRESGDFESDGDVVAFLHRDMRTPEEKESDKGKRGDVPEDGVCEFIIRKARVGETGLVNLKFTARCTRFDNFTSEGYR